MSQQIPDKPAVAIIKEILSAAGDHFSHELAETLKSFP